MCEVEEISHVRYTTGLKGKVYEFTWQVNNFSLYELNSGEFLRSCYFPEKRETDCWYLTLFPKSIGQATEQYISLFINSEFETKVSCIFILKRKDDKSYQMKFDSHSVTNEGWGYIKFIKRETVFDQNCGFLVDDTLTVYCKVTILKSVENQLKLAPLFPNIKNHFEGLDYEISKQKFTDITLIASGQAFPAHRVILATQSKVFEAMFSHDMKENQTKCVEISDFNDAILQAALQHVYSGKCPELSLEYTIELLRFSDIYDMCNLKLECAKKLSYMVNTKTVIDIILAADMHNQYELKKYCLDYILFNLNDVLKRDEWKRKLSSRSELFVDIIQKLATEKEACNSCHTLALNKNQYIPCRAEGVEDSDDSDIE